jgi:DNA polymerase-3 subunit beta
VKFSVQQEEFAAALAAAGRSTSQGRDNPALAGIQIELVDGRLTISATDGNRSIKVPVHLAGSPEGEGRVLLPGKVLPGLANSLRSGVVEFALRPDQQDVEIKSGSSLFHVRTLNADDFPPLPSLGGDSVSLDREVLVETVDLVAGAASTADMRPVLGAVQVTISGDTLTMAATDSYRLAVRETKVPTPVSSDVEANVPADSLKELVRILSGSETEQVKMSIGDREAVFDLDGTIFSTTMIDGQFPKYQQLFPESWEFDVRLDRNELLEAIKRVGGVLDRDGRLIKVTLNSGELTLAAETPELGDASETIPAGFEGEEMTVGFDHTYFREGVDSIKGEEVMLRLISPLRPGLILPIGEEGFRYLLMPLRLAD